MAVTVLVAFGMVAVTLAVTATLPYAIAVVRRRIREARETGAATGARVAACASPGWLADRAVDPEDAERDLVADLLAGRLDPTSYQAGMAAVAADGRIDGARAEPVVLLIVGAGSPGLLAKLATALPELPLTTVRAAVSLVRYQAGADELVRLLDLTGAQALRIVTSVRYSGHRQDR